jgi:hypothetical protein
MEKSIVFAVFIIGPTQASGRPNGKLGLPGSDHAVGTALTTV